MVRAAERVLSSNIIGIYAFGSVVSGGLVASSDIDVLVVVSDLPRPALARSGPKRMVVEEAGLPLVHPFEPHLVEEEEAPAYLHRIKGNSPIQEPDETSEIPESQHEGFEEPGGNPDPFGSPKSLRMGFSHFK